MKLMGADLNLNPKITLKYRKQNPKEHFFSFTPTLTHAKQLHSLTAPTKRHLPALHPFRQARDAGDDADHHSPATHLFLPFSPTREILSPSSVARKKNETNPTVCSVTPP